jgi:hypothetical protein
MDVELSHLYVTLWHLRYILSAFGSPFSILPTPPPPPRHYAILFLGPLLLTHVQVHGCAAGNMALPAALPVFPFYPLCVASAAVTVLASSTSVHSYLMVLLLASSL